jgi:hypothetical protein
MKVVTCALVLSLLTSSVGFADNTLRYKTVLEGFNLNGLPVATNATGEARVEVIDDGTALDFSVNVAGIENLLMAHIHVAPAPVEVTDPAGPIAFWITGGPPPGTTVTEPVNGRLAAGFIITQGQLRLWGDPDPALDGTIEGLIRAIGEGRASVIVHTDDLDAATPTGVQGDSRAGELRGTLR